MAIDESRSTRLARLRERAEAVLQSQSRDLPDVSPEELDQLVYDLSTHQIELEMQNEELRRVQEELVESRDRYSDLYDSAPVGYFTLSLKGSRIVEANLSLAEQLGVERRHLVKHRFSEFVAPDSEDVFYLHRREVLETGTTQTCELQLKREGDTSFYAQLRSRPVWDAEGQLSQLRTAVTDISERKAAEEELRRMEAQLAHAGRLSTMGEMVAGIAHEIQQPLLAIVNFAKANKNLLAVAGEGPNLDGLRRWNDEIAAAAASAGDVVKRLRGFVRKAQPRRSRTSLGGIIEEAVRLVSFEAEQRQIEVRFDRCEGLPRVRGDRVEIQQVLVNLLRNACEAIEQEGGGSRRITIRTSLVGAAVEVAVADTGPGLPANQEMRLFDAFVTTKRDGLGMGLPISKTIVQSHGGRLWANSNPEGGATFCFSLPVCEDSVACHSRTTGDRAHAD